RRRERAHDHLGEHGRRAAAREPQGVERVVDGLAADHVEDVARLARRDRRAAVHRPEGLFAHGHSPGVAALAVVWPRKMRVRANSPSLCPTISSVTNTRTNVFPLWTANVWPTKSGMIVDERLHVRSGSRWLWDFC